MDFQLKYNLIQGFIMISVITTALSELNLNSIFKTPSNDSKSPWIWTLSIYEIDDASYVASLPEALKPPLQRQGLDESKVKFITDVNETHVSETWRKTWVIYWLDGIVEVDAKFVRGIIDERDGSSSLSMSTDQRRSSKHSLVRIQSIGSGAAKYVFELLSNVETRISDLSGTTLRDVKNDPLTLIMTSTDSLKSTVKPHTTPNDFTFNPDTIPENVTIIFEGLDDVTTEVPKINLVARNHTKEDDVLTIRLLDIPDAQNISIFSEGTGETAMQNVSTENGETSRRRDEISDHETEIFESSNLTSKDLEEFPENVTIIFEDMNDNSIMNLTKNGFTDVPSLTIRQKFQSENNSKVIDESVILNINAVKTTTSGSWDIPDDVTIIFEGLDEMTDNISKTNPVISFRNPEDVKLKFKGLDQEVINATESPDINEGIPEDVTITFEDRSILKTVNQTEESGGKSATTVTDLFTARSDTTPNPTSVVTKFFGLLNTIPRNHAEPPTTATTPLPPSFESLSTNRPIENAINSRSIFRHNFESTVNPILEKPTANPGLENPTANPGAENPTANPGLEKPTANPGLEKPTANPGLENPTTNPTLEQPPRNIESRNFSTNPVLELPSANLVTEQPSLNPLLVRPNGTLGLILLPTVNRVHVQPPKTIRVEQPPAANRVHEQPPAANRVLEQPPPVAIRVLEQPPPVAIRVLEQPPVTIRELEQPLPVANRVLEQPPPVTIRVLEQPPVTIRVLEQPPVTIRVLEQPPVTIRELEQPPPVANRVLEQPPPVANRVLEQPPPVANRVLEQPPSVANRVLEQPPPVANRVLEQPLAVNRVFEQPPPPVNRVFEQPPPPANRVFEQPPPANRVLEQPPAANRVLEQPPVANRVLEQPPVANRVLEQPPVANRVLEQPPQAIWVHEQPPAANQVLQQPPTDDLLSGKIVPNKPTLNIDPDQLRNSLFPDPIPSMVIKTLQRPLVPSRLEQLVDGQSRMTRLSVNSNTRRPESVGHRSSRLRRCRAARDCDHRRNERCVMGVCDCGRKYVRDFRSGKCLENFFTRSYAGRIPLPYQLVYLKY